MIVEWIVSVAMTVWDWLATLVPDFTAPAALTGLSSSLGSIFALGQGMAPFVDWSAVGVMAAIPLGLWVVTIAWAGLRMLVSHIPFIGGR
jgi:hypothetical protein